MRTDGQTLIMEKVALKNAGQTKHTNKNIKISSNNINDHNLELGDIGE